MHAPTLIVLNGPIASGKSTVARALAGIAEAHGRRAAAIDLDELWHMVDHQQPRTGRLDGWLTARRAAAAVTDVFLASGIKVIVVEGPFFSAEERDGYLGWLRSDVTPTFVTLSVSFEDSLRRALADSHPDRVISRDTEWLRARYELTREMYDKLPRGELIVNTNAKTAQQVASEIAETLGISGPISARREAPI